MLYSIFRRVPLLAFAALAIIITVLVIDPLQAFAQDANESVKIPLGAWIETLAPAVGAVILAAITWLMRKLPATVVDVLRTFKADQLLANAVNYGINAAAGAAHDKVLTVNVGNSVVANGVQYAVDNGPAWLIKWMGGPDAIAAKIIARLPMENSASVFTTSMGKPVLVQGQ